MFCGFVCSFVCLLLFQTMAAGESKQIQNHEQLQETVLSFKWPVLRSALRMLYGYQRSHIDFFRQSLVTIFA